MTAPQERPVASGQGIDASANQATLQKRQEAGLRAGLALHVLFRHTRNSDEKNAVFAPPLQQLASAIADLVATDGHFDLRFTSDGLRANHQVLRVDALTRPVIVGVQGELTARGLAGLQCAGVPPEADLRTLVALLSLGRRLPEGGDPQRPLAVLQLTPLGQREAQEVHGPDLEERLVEAYSSAALFAARTISQLRRGGEVAPAWAAGHVVRELVDLQREAPLSFLRLSRSKAVGDDYWGHHAANVAVLAISMGARLGLSKRRRHDLGMSAVFHDVGMAAMPEAVLGKPATLDDRERWAVLANPLFAARVLLREREVHAAALERALAAYECHLDLEAPEPGEQHEVGFCGRVIALCESFDAMTTQRPYRGALHPREALAAMRGELAYRFDQRLLKLFGAVVNPLL